MGLLGGSTLVGGTLDATAVYLHDLALLQQNPTNQVYQAQVFARHFGTIILINKNCLQNKSGVGARITLPDKSCDLKPLADLLPNSKPPY